MTQELIPEVERKTLSHSEVESFLQCERKHYYSYGLKIDSLGKSDALERGSSGHTFLEAYFKSQRAAQEAGKWNRDSQAEAIKQVAELIRDAYPDSPAKMTEQMVLFHKFTTHSDFYAWRILATEYEFKIPIDEDGTESYGFIDLIAEDPYGYVWVIDFKFAYDFFPEEVIEMLPQLPKYVWALRKMGLPADKAGYAEVRTRSVKSTEAHDNYRFREVPVPEHKVERVMREQILVGQRIKARKNLPLSGMSDMAVRTANKLNCDHCSFKPLCSAEMNDPDKAQLVLDTYYTEKKRR